MKLSLSSEKKLVGVHPDLVKIVRQAALDTDLDFIVTEGVRTAARQAELYAAGASKLKTGGRHQIGDDAFGHAVDLAAMIGTEARWDWPLYSRLANTMKGAAAKLDIPLEWGGDWRTFKDGPHFQLPQGKYP